MANIELDGANKKIKVDSGDLTLDVPGDIVLDADGGDVVVADGGTNILKVTNSSSDVVLQPQVDAKDIIFKQFDGTTVATVEDNGTFNIPASKLAIGDTAVTSTAAELNILDGVTSTAAELNIVDGNTSATSTTIADADRVVLNDNGTMVQVAVTDLKTYIGGGGLVHIATSTASSASSVHLNSVFSSTYDQYFITYAITFSSDAGKARARYQNTSDSEITDTYLQSSVRDSGSSSASGNYNSTNYFILNDDGQSNFSNIPLHGHMYISNPSSSSIQTQFRNFASTADAGRNSGYEISGGRLQENTAVGGLKIYPDGGTFGSATIRVYGIVNS